MVATAADPNKAAGTDLRRSVWAVVFSPSQMFPYFEDSSITAPLQVVVFTLLAWLHRQGVVRVGLLLSSKCA